MNLRYLGEQIDIHGGGNDLVFPHHENEIAQTESVTGKPMARYWIHNGMLQLQGEKMSKSLGNLVSVEEFLRKHEADAFRMLVLSSSYRSPLTFNAEVVQQAERALERMRGASRPASSSAEVSTQVEADLVAKVHTSGSGSGGKGRLRTFGRRDGNGRRFQYAGRLEPALRAGACH
jgi:cysteinyl-tRNA synthetase